MPTAETELLTYDAPDAAGHFGPYGGRSCPRPWCRRWKR